MDKSSQFTSQTPSHFQQLKSSDSMASMFGAEDDEELLLWSVSQHSNKDAMLRLRPQLLDCEMNRFNSFDYMLKNGCPSNMAGDLLEQTDMISNSHTDAHEKWTHMYSKLVHDLKSILTPELVPVVHLQVSEERSNDSLSSKIWTFVSPLSLTSNGPSKMDRADKRGPEGTIRSSDTARPHRSSSDTTTVSAVSMSRNSLEGDDEIRLAGSPNRGDASVRTSNAFPPRQPLSSRSFIIREKDIPETSGRKVVITRSLSSRSSQTPFVADFYSSSVLPLLE
jgi:hypothetical protein